MKKFTFKRMNLIMPFILILLLSSVTFGQIKKVTTPSIAITFRADMTYQYEKGAFNPFMDTLDVTGTMNGWAGSPHMNSIGSSLIYEIVYTLDSNTIQEYKFRINGNSATTETVPNRMYLVPDHADTITSIYNDYEPGTVPVTFKCHMGYQMETGHFNKSNDYLDIAGNFNNWGAYDVLFDRGDDSVYVINMNVDTINIVNNTPLEFKFRINGNWATSEFPDGAANRMLRVEDTTNGFQNIVDVWYNDEDPAIPAPPVAFNVDLQGNLAVGETLTGSYSYIDVNGDPEGNSHYNWYRADSLSQPEPEEIIGVMSVNYLLTAADAHKYIAFQVTPVSATGDPPAGNPVRIWTTNFVSGVGIDETNHLSIRFFPNPVSDFLNIESSGSIEKIEIYNIIGEKMISCPVLRRGNITLNTSLLNSGVYFIKIYQENSGTSTSKFLKK
jgi:hypothetical protein